MWDERLTTVAGRAYVNREQCKKGKPQATLIRLRRFLYCRDI